MKLFKYAAFLSLSLLFTYCGDSKNKSEEKEQIKLRSDSGEVKEVDENVTEVVLLATDLMKFNKEEIRVPAGKTVRLILRHTGVQPKEVMGHNFVLLAQGTDIPTFAAKAAAARDNDYIPQGSDAVIVHTKMLGGGQSDVIEFEPPAPGTYDFICSFPGHYSLMQGKFIVEE